MTHQQVFWHINRSYGRFRNFCDWLLMADILWHISRSYSRFNICFDRLFRADTVKHWQILWQIHDLLWQTCHRRYCDALADSMTYLEVLQGNRKIPLEQLQYLIPPWTTINNSRGCDIFKDSITHRRMLRQAFDGRYFSYYNFGNATVWCSCKYIEILAEAATN